MRFFTVCSFILYYSIFLGEFRIVSGIILIDEFRFLLNRFVY